MADPPISFTPSGPPETVLDAEPGKAVAALEDACASGPSDVHGAIASVVARWPRFLDAWARLGDHGRDTIEAYAAYRVGYHRGLDRLRASGWRGSGYVRWQHPTNRGFLRALHGLEVTARAIGEQDEADRCGGFLRQLDPSWPPEELNR